MKQNADRAAVEKIAATINEFWARSGREANARVVANRVQHSDGRTLQYVIYSDLVNGYPPKPQKAER